MSDELKTPWAVATHPCGYANSIKGVDGKTVADLIKTEAEAATIVHRVNCHDKLVEALRELVAVCDLLGIECSSEVKDAKAALELAKGGTHE